MSILSRGRGESGLVGMLVAVVVLGTMAAVALAALGGSGGDPRSERAGRAAEVVPADGADLGAAQSRPALRPGIDQGSRNACALDARTLSTAAQAYQAARGDYPATVDDLVAVGLLSQAPAGHAFTFESVGGKPTGRVLVDGADVDSGCAAAPAR